MLQSKKYNVELEADKKLTEANEVNSILKSQLPRELNFRIIPLTKDTLVNIIRIADSSKLEKHLSKSSGQVAHWNKESWKSEGASLNYLQKFIENEYRLLSEVADQTHQSTYDFVLPINDFEKLKEVLMKEYGIEVQKAEKEITLFQIVEKN